MAPTHHFAKDIIDRAAETGAPLIVRRRCNPHQLAIWMAVRFLLDTTDRSSFGSREIAREANLSSYPRVAGWIGELVEMELLEIIGHEQVQGDMHDRPVYRIPFRKILDNSTAEAEQHVIEQVNRRRRRKAVERGAGQLTLDLTVTDRSQKTVTDRSQAVTDRSQQTPVYCDRSVTLDGGMDGLMEGGTRAHAQKRKRGRPPNPPAVQPPPDPPTDEAPLPAHPTDLWTKACPTPRPIDLDHLAALAAEHDAPTDDHGLYWVGRAILAASLVEDVRQVGKVRKILDRWRRGACYGSDLPRKESTDGRTPTGARSRPAAVGTRPGDDRAPSGERGPIRSKLDY